jgi:hypothetical protein
MRPKPGSPTLVRYSASGPAASSATLFGEWAAVRGIRGKSSSSMPCSGSTSTSHLRCVRQPVVGKVAGLL